MSENVQTTLQSIELFKMKIDKLEKDMEKVQRYGAKKLDVKDQIDMLRAVMENSDNKLAVVKKSLA